MKLQAKVDSIEMSLEVDEEKVFGGIAPNQRAFAHKMLQQELDVVLQGQAHLLAAIINMGPLQSLLLDLMASKMTEVSNAALRYIAAIQRGQDPMEILAEYLLREITDHQLKNGAFGDFIDNLDLDTPDKDN